MSREVVIIITSAPQVAIVSSAQSVIVLTNAPQTEVILAAQPSPTIEIQPD